ncbi:MAG: cell division protein FtsZ [Nitrospiraceae bacterium]|nr:cell division protein FtsZ [Nitrospiraceae bacterium]
MSKNHEGFLFKEPDATSAKLKVIGVGGGGCNAVNSMVADGLTGVDFIAANTDLQALEKSLAPSKIQLGKERTKGLGAGADPDIGAESALEQSEEIRQVLDGADMVFVTAGMGGGTGTGAAPVISSLARDLGALTVAVVTKPFPFEGGKRMCRAEEGVAQLKRNTDTLLAIPNQRLLKIIETGTPLTEAFIQSNTVLRHAIAGIADVITTPGLVNVDFADVRAVMNHMGRAVLGMGRARGEERAVMAARDAISSPLLEDGGIAGARALLFNITGGADLSLHEVSAAAEVIHEEADKDANIIFGAVVNPDFSDEVVITVIATGFDRELALAQPVSKNVSASSTNGAGREPCLTSVGKGVVSPGRNVQRKLPLMDAYETPTFLRQGKHTS